MPTSSPPGLKPSKQPILGAMGGFNKRKQGGQKPGGKPSKKPKKQPTSTLQDVPLPEAADDGSDVELSDEDMAMVAEYGQNLGFLKSLNTDAMDRALKERQRKDLQAAQAAAAVAAAKAAGSGSEDEDGSDQEDYERRPRQSAKVRCMVCVVKCMADDNAMRAVLSFHLLEGELLVLLFSYSMKRSAWLWLHGCRPRCTCVTVAC